MTIMTLTTTMMLLGITILAVACAPSNALPRTRELHGPLLTGEDVAQYRTEARWCNDHGFAAPPPYQGTQGTCVNESCNRTVCTTTIFEITTWYDNTTGR